MDGPMASCQCLRSTSPELVQSTRARRFFECSAFETVAASVHNRSGPAGPGRSIQILAPKRASADWSDPVPLPLAQEEKPRPTFRLSSLIDLIPGQFQIKTNCSNRWTLLVT